MNLLVIDFDYILINVPGYGKDVLQECKQKVKNLSKFINKSEDKIIFIKKSYNQEIYEKMKSVVGEEGYNIIEDLVLKYTEYEYSRSVYDPIIAAQEKFNFNKVAVIGSFHSIDLEVDNLKVFQINSEYAACDETYDKINKFLTNKEEIKILN